MVIADLHIHSKYSRATSRDCDLHHLDLWARRKGIHLLGTGDFTHPAWRGEMEELLVPTGDGFYTLKDSARMEDETAGESIQPRFVVSGEISSIYKKMGKQGRYITSFCSRGLRKPRRFRTSWRPSATSIRMGVQFLGWTAATCSKLRWKSARSRFLFRPIFGRPIFPCSAPFQGLIPLKNVLKT